MEFETPVDAWYVWVAVAVASVAIAGVALSLPTRPPPDATAAANTIDRIAGSTQVAGASYDHAADEIRLDTTRISMRNDGGTAHASVAFRSLTPVFAVNNATIHDALLAVLHGTPPSAVLERPAFAGLDESDLRVAAGDARAAHLDEPPEWRPANGTLHVRKLELDGVVVVLVDA
jgi:hypothetical protein